MSYVLLYTDVFPSRSLRYIGLRSCASQFQLLTPFLDLSGNLTLTKKLLQEHLHDKEFKNEDDRKEPILTYSGLGIKVSSKLMPISFTKMPFIAKKVRKERCVESQNNLVVDLFSADTRLDERRDALCIVNYTGYIQWVPQGIYMSTCDVDVYSFPFDKQVCTLKFGSWTYDGTKLDFDFHGEEKMNPDDYFVPNKAWTVLETPGKRNVHTYACCLETYIDLTYTVVFRRTATFYSYILILPCVLLTSLTLVLFWIPPESPTKMALG